MEPLEWQRLADEAAAHFRGEIEALSAAYRDFPTDGSFDAFWVRARDLNEQLRAAPAIKLDDKLGLQASLNQLCERTRQDQGRLREETARARQEIADSLALARESIELASRADEIQAARLDLTALRERITGADSPLDRRERHALWLGWHEANQLAWTRLNDCWQVNEGFLSSLLDDANSAIGAGRAREARDKIRDFHAAIASRECSRRSLRGLQSRAGELWQAAEELARKKREAYVANAGKRIGRWKAELRDHQRSRATLVAEMQGVEQQLEDATTDVAVALLRGQLTSLARELDRLEANDRRLQLRIVEAESAVGQS